MANLRFELKKEIFISASNWNTHWLLAQGRGVAILLYKHYNQMLFRIAVTSPSLTEQEEKSSLQ